MPAFRDNEIDWDALPKHSVEDLKDLGLVLGGHRRKLLDAIAALGAAAPAASATAAPRDAPALAEAERRQLTVMFCDLVGSTALSTRFDVEDLREMIGAYHRCVADTVTRFAGFIAKYMGDGVLVYFGYPQAHEDDAERAVRAGLGSIDAVRRLDAKSVKLLTRVGIATGFVVVGDLIGAGSAQESVSSVINSPGSLGPVNYTPGEECAKGRLESSSLPIGIFCRSGISVDQARWGGLQWRSPWRQLDHAAQV